MSAIYCEQKIDELRRLYDSFHKQIEQRMAEFRKVWETQDEERIFSELIFCLLTPQSRAQLCWSAVERMRNKNILLCDNYSDIIKCLDKVRFKYTKAQRICEVISRFGKDSKCSIVDILNRLNNPAEIREWLVENIKGLGYKEASHFLRNIGLGQNFAILDRHIMRNLMDLSIIEKIPQHISKRRYMEYENKMREFATFIGIPISHLDMLFWAKQTGVIFK